MSAARVESLALPIAPADFAEHVRNLIMEGLPTPTWVAFSDNTIHVEPGDLAAWLDFLHADGEWTTHPLGDLFAADLRGMRLVSFRPHECKP